MVGRSGFWTYVLDLLAVSGVVCLSFRDRFDILLEKRPSGVAELRYAMLYGKSQEEAAIKSGIRIWSKCVSFCPFDLSGIGAVLSSGWM